MLRFSGLLVLLVLFFPVGVFAQEAGAVKPAAETQEIVLADGSVLMKVPGHWKKVQPKSNIIEAEFAIEKSEGETANGRVTLSQSAGSIQQNIERWYGQFELDGEPGEPVVKEVNKVKVHIVDLKGTYLDTMGNPGGPAAKRENYRMLAAIIEMPEGKYFVKCYGPATMMEKNLEAFQKMIESVRVVQ